ncbi:carbonic anhydrase family protein [Chryseobacterium sp. ES2]|uniref:Carbonic anhydrase family protein n=1 Tax=Chryseobacterium metallicongregator TaxID=3073042 RepID=A0ABU1DZQ4_9FLAO|nr:carbonic anhydrase family protein [Chryseobacterium sp. ES2]MDR4951028.1 carbonic anhydrase family protein [Chryseobacterium sp. ES2]
MNRKKILLLSLLCGLTVSCNKSENKEAQSKISSHVMTKEQQNKLTGEEVLKDFIEGNKRFQDGTITMRDHTRQTRMLVTGQYPKAVVISCLDSRVPVEDIFDQGLGDVFVGRVAGNFVDEDLLGSIEFACKVAGAKLVLVMGHQHCGAIKGAIDDVKLGNITAMLSKIKPAVNISQNYTGKKSSQNDDFVKFVSENNVRIALRDIRTRSPILKEMEDKGQIKIMGAFYRITDGTLEFIK